MANAKSTKTGGKQYAVPGLPDGTVSGVNKPDVGLDDAYWEGTSGAPEQQERAPFGKTNP